jgi:hypothetical protein
LRRAVDHPQVKRFEIGCGATRDFNAVCHACGAADRIPAARAWCGRP